jgi:hypothetical protein
MLNRITFFIGLIFMVLTFFTGEEYPFFGGAILASAALIAEAIAKRNGPPT